LLLDRVPFEAIERVDVRARVTGFLENPAIQILDSTGVSVNGVSVPEGVPAVGVDRSMRVKLMNIVARDRKEPNKP